MADMTATELAERLGVTRRRATALLASGAVTGRRLANGMWLADTDSVSRYESAARRGQGRTLDAATAWGLLWELSGLDADWLTPSTRSRIRRRIREAGAEELSRAVASRTIARHYRAANSERAAEGLIRTGRAAIGSLGTELIEDRRRVSGYARTGTPDDYAAAHFMVADIAGQDVIFENTLPILYVEDTMPAAVIAADLAVSTDTRERSAGQRALEGLRQSWLAAH
jgi:hypothetical protein